VIILFSVLWACSDGGSGEADGFNGDTPPPEENLRDYSILMGFNNAVTYFSDVNILQPMRLDFGITFFTEVGYDMPDMQSCTITRKFVDGQVAHSFNISPTPFTVQSINGKQWNAYNYIDYDYDHLTKTMTVSDDTFSLNNSTSKIETDATGTTYEVPYSFSCTSTDEYIYKDINEEYLHQQPKLIISISDI
jgi:hypothetical protein